MTPTQLKSSLKDRTPGILVVLVVLVLMVPSMATASAQGDRPDRGATGPRTTAVGDPSQDESDDPQDPGTGSTTTEPSSTTSSVPRTTEPPTDTTEETTTTTVPYVPPVPPELADDPRLPFLSDPDEDEGFDVPIAQNSFDPLSVGVLPERIFELRLALMKEVDDAFDSLRRLAELSASVDHLKERVQALDARTKREVRRAAAARRRLRDHAVLAYTQGRGDLELSVLELSDAVDIAVAKQYLSVLMGRQAGLIEEYERATRRLDAESIALADELGVETSRLEEARAEMDAGAERIAELKKELAVYELGAHAYVAGFVFPLASEAEFIDSWGYPRMVGTASEHWHQGTDIFAPYGAPAVAAENGVIERLGQASLGGNKLWVRGDSGMSYYYAHLSGFAEGMHNGRRVRAGEVVGYVGDTGNAKGTSPHLHFETHPAGREVVNAYPLLRAAYGNRKAFRAVVETTPAPDPQTVEPSAGG